MRTFAKVVWLLALMLSVGAAAIFVHGLIRDSRMGEPELAVNLAAASDWQTQRFRVWRSGSYILYLTSVNHTPPFEVSYHGAVEVRLGAPSGRDVFRSTYEGAALEHVRPQNMQWTALDTLDLNAQPLRSWTLSTRVTTPDPQFDGVRSVLRLRRIRYDPGMGGLINYVMIIPAAAFAVIALMAAAVLARSGSRKHLWISGAWFLLLLLLLSGHMIA